VIVRGFFVGGCSTVDRDLKIKRAAGDCTPGWGSFTIQSRILLNRTLLLAAILLTRNRLQVNLDTAVLRTAIDVAVAGNRVIRAGATGDRLAPLTPCDVR
jgi:hypothetical protein